MSKTISFEEFRDGISDAELAFFVKTAKKRRLIYFLVYIGLIVVFALLASAVGSSLSSGFAIVGYVIFALIGIFAGFGCFANNVARFADSQGRKNGGIASGLWCLCGGVIIPLIVLFICRRVNAYKTVLGWDPDKARRHIPAPTQRSYQNGSNGQMLIDTLLDPDNTDPITLMGQDGRVISFEQLAIIPYYVDNVKTMFAVLRPIDKVEGIADNEAVVFRAIPQSDGDVKLLAEPDERIAISVFDKFKSL